MRFGRLADAAALTGVSDEGPRRDRLFDMLMRRIDALQQHRAGVLALLRALPVDPCLALLLAAANLRSMRWMLEGAGISAVGPHRHAARAKGCSPCGCGRCAPGSAMRATTSPPPWPRSTRRSPAAEDATAGSAAAAQRPAAHRARANPARGGAGARRLRREPNPRRSRWRRMPTSQGAIRWAATRRSFIPSTRRGRRPRNSPSSSPT